MVIPNDMQSITVEWLTAAIGGQEFLGDATVVSFHIRRIGEEQGWTGQVARIELEYSHPTPGAPSTAIVKFSPTDTDGVFGLREVIFYQKIAAHQGFDVPGCYHSEVNRRTGENILLLEDMSRLSTVDFVDGCTPVQAEATVLALARIHAHGWGDPDIETKDWLFSIADSNFAQWWGRYPDEVVRLLPDLDLSPRLLEFGNRFASDMPTVLDRIEGAPLTYIHRDIHVDNLLFGSTPDDPPVVLVDWQTVGRGLGVSDIAYLLISSLSPEDRRASERRLVTLYHEYLVSDGIDDYPFDQCWSDYLVSVASKLFITVTATINFDNSSPHRRAWRMADLQRLTAFFSDHDPIREL